MGIKTTFSVGGELSISRLGFGAMRICGEGIWDWPNDRDAARQVLRRAVELGINLIDTADAYGPEVSEYLIAEALRPYPDGLMIATKGGLVRGGPGSWQTDGRPKHLERAVENSLRRLRTERIDLYQLHAIDDDVELEDSLGALARMQEAGKIRFIGVSNFRVADLDRARRVVDVVTVQNRYNLTDRKHDDVLEYCAQRDIGFIPYFPLAMGNLASDQRLERVARAHDASSSQVALAWLLHRSPVMLPIPGTASLSHLEENARARDIKLSENEVETLSALHS